MTVPVSKLTESAPRRVGNDLTDHERRVRFHRDVKLAVGNRFRHHDLPEHTVLTLISTKPTGKAFRSFLLHGLGRREQILDQLFVVLHIFCGVAHNLNSPIYLSGSPTTGEHGFTSLLLTLPGQE